MASLADDRFGSDGRFLRLGREQQPAPGAPEADLTLLAFVWTADRVAAVVTGLALIVFLYVFFFGKRRVVARPVPAGPQEVTVVVAGGYKPDVIVARRGMPLKLIFDRRESNPCSDEIVLPEFGIRAALPAHQKTTIEIMPQREGEFPFSCGMNMLHGKIRVVP